MYFYMHTQNKGLQYKIKYAKNINFNFLLFFYRQICRLWYNVIPGV